MPKENNLEWIYGPRKSVMGHSRNMPLWTRSASPKPEIGIEDEPYQNEEIGPTQEPHDFVATQYYRIPWSVLDQGLQTLGAQPIAVMAPRMDVALLPDLASYPVTRLVMFVQDHKLFDQFIRMCPPRFTRGSEEDT
ncbi:hypothetical protein HAX54_036703 [Datura stramonium]|uniref:Uncharacterized protein n=1 Tax=Datura stramonium TaxID=4076 RepID=A0ABS8VHE2_DATST|nr:hypothetical protein [Datura stramonium]